MENGEVGVRLLDNFLEGGGRSFLINLRFQGEKKRDLEGSGAGVGAVEQAIEFGILEVGGVCFEMRGFGSYNGLVKFFRINS